MAAQRKSVKAEGVTVEALRNIELDADLTILYSEIPSMPEGARIHLVGGEPFSDRGSLRMALASLPQDSSIEVQLYEKDIEPILIEESVEADGMVAVLAADSGFLSSDDDESFVPIEKIRSVSKIVRHASNVGGGGGAHVVASRPGGYSPPAARTSPGRESPQLCEFSQIDVTSATFAPLSEAIPKNGLYDALKYVPRGHCVVTMSNSVNPLAEIEIISKIMRREFICIDCSVKLRLRPSQTEIAQSLMEAMESGRWFVVLQAHKSMATLRVLDTVLEQHREDGYKHFHAASRIIIVTDPHPHFPPKLLESATVLKLRASFSAALHETMAASISRRRVVGAMSSLGALPAVPTRTEGPGVVEEGGKPKRKHVQMNAAVEIVEIPPREVTATVTKTSGPIAGRIKLEHQFRGLETDKFLCIGACGVNDDRVAVASSLGNVYFLDLHGASLTTMHAHDACIWDISCQSGTTFVTGSEDCSAIRWGPQESGFVQQNQIAKCGHDIFAVTYYEKTNPNSPIFLGGLMSVVVALLPKGQAKQVPVPTSTQALMSIPSLGTVAAGGGDGSLMLIDANRMEMKTVIPAHKKKVPCLTYVGDNLLATGSFDCSIKLWDLRTPNDPVHTLKLKNYVTGIGSNEGIIAASVGDNLYMWDHRKISEVLGGFPQAWDGLSRGLVVNHAHRRVITASPDGVVRYWKYQ